jgi:glycosyltransferase involved in cell wall biosynthesis
VLGFVEDLDPLYARAVYALVPLLSGGGSPLKFIEGLAHGVPVVATPRAVAGVDAEAGRHYVEGEGADGFASGLVEALDPVRGAEVGAAGRALAQSEYSVEALARRLAE